MLIAAKVNLFSVYKRLSGSNPAHVHTPKCSQNSINTGNKQFRLNRLAEQWGNGNYEEGVWSPASHRKSGRSVIALSTTLTPVPVFEGLFKVVFSPNRYVSACVGQPAHVDICDSGRKCRHRKYGVWNKRATKSSDNVTTLPGTWLTHGGRSVVGTLCFTTFSSCSRNAKARLIL